MIALWVLIALSLGLAILAGVAYLWANHSGQYDDLDSPAEKLVFEDLTPKSFAPLEYAKSLKSSLKEK